MVLAKRLVFGLEVGTCQILYQCRRLSVAQRSAIQFEASGFVFGPMPTDLNIGLDGREEELVVEEDGQVVVASAGIQLAVVWRGEDQRT